MMAHSNPSGGTTALGFDLAATVGKKVVRLPTAQRRQVQQPHNKAGRAARLRLRESQRRQFNYEFPSIRDARRKLLELYAMPPSPMVSFVRNVIDAANAGDSMRAMGVIKTGVAVEDPFALEVQALFEKVVGRTFGEQNDFLQVRAQLAKETM
ncbi:MAG: hypothetical protein ABIO85_00360 [Sphingomicrobium sp.]